MPGEKKGLSAFIKKQQKNKKPAPAGAEGQSSTTVGYGLDSNAHDTEVGTSQSKGEKNTPVQNKNVDDSSDEEEDDLNQMLKVGNIKEKKDVVNKNATNNENKKGYGLDSETNKAADTGFIRRNVGEKKMPEAPVNFGGPTDIKSGSGITFGGGKPKFGRRKPTGKFGDDFKAGLDDIEDEGRNTFKAEKEERSKANSGYGADGGREFINLGSTAQGARTEEFKEMSSRPAAVKPTFRGKLNLTKMGGAAPKDDDTGVKPSYDFNVTFKSAEPDGERRERKPFNNDEPATEATTMEVRKDKRQFNKARQNDTKTNDFDDEFDEGFEIVRNKDRKMKKTQQNSDSSDDEDDRRPSRFTNSNRDAGVRIERGGNRGGRGGFFKNSKHEAGKDV